MNTFIHYHTLDLRIHDSPSLHKAHQPNNRSTHFLPLYIFDPRQLDLSQFPNTSSSRPAQASTDAPNQDGSAKFEPRQTRCSPKSRVGKFHRTSPYRLKFLLEAVYSLRESYRRSGGDMLIAYGPPEKIIPQLIAELQKNGGEIEGFFAQREYTVEEISNYRRISDGLASQKGNAKGDKGVKLEFNDSKTLIPPGQLPFDPSRDTPDVYTEFRKKVEGLGIGLDEMLKRPLQTSENVDGEIRVKVGNEKLKPFPDVKFDHIKLGEGDGGFLISETVEEVYAKLVRPLLDNPPIGGWSSAAASASHQESNGNANGKGEIPELHSASAIPFEGSVKAALDRIDDYIGQLQRGQWQGGNKAKHYKETRNGLLGEGFSTKFSSWLSLGSVSPKEIGWRVGQLMEKEGRDKEVWKNVYWILFELLWRDYFQYTVLKTSLSDQTPKSRSKTTSSPDDGDEYHPNSSLFNPDGFSSQISTYPKDLRPKPSEWHSANLQDENDPARRWCEGRTGVPFIDANMRELIQTGWMSNRGRQNVASFLTKDLYCDWRIGAEFFEMHLVDYDTCSNWGNWQYQAGVGNDPRSSRQFNPIKQARDYDENNEFVRTWIPELKDLPKEYIQTPWLLNDPSKLGGYPSKPIVELPSWKKHYPNQPSGRNRYGKDGKQNKNKNKAKGNGKGPGGGKSNSKQENQ
ncbi:uncharacterized protein I303_105841 [Kwoniella dejecticola CBS 10117]|uniref:Cryptochrome DASH n=1 Tax=Kwoniella dejecticola CBS 10117 TaxID=1296121 RepID=A0A1A6A0I1_9TREE|nr:uncharacterized protein I303_05862 [Kwoniella dejecticola CBS 10117]OBR83582.1 hypothetical protein I303_05862 [Kwoniella dejecticola CBS 10117]